MERITPLHDESSTLTKQGIRSMPRNSEASPFKPGPVDLFKVEKKLTGYACKKAESPKNRQHVFFHLKTNDYILFGQNFIGELLPSCQDITLFSQYNA
uniref:Uncharacterized protein n=1 Tax=Romanomermis culicivorax TaxID=13658 RepID=A0A915KFR4_ROMCU